MGRPGGAQGVRPPPAALVTAQRRTAGPGRGALTGAAGRGPAASRAPTGPQAAGASSPQPLGAQWTAGAWAGLAPVGGPPGCGPRERHSDKEPAERPPRAWVVHKRRDQGQALSTTPGEGAVDRVLGATVFSAALGYTTCHRRSLPSRHATLTHTICSDVSDAIGLSPLHSLYPYAPSQMMVGQG